MEVENSGSQKLGKGEERRSGEGLVNGYSARVR
jgi:hypothetical protein